tara:strand:+ start:16375 stop:16515 length:141 start_codon:yes stop_codon:yes gene_type:complete
MWKISIKKRVLILFLFLILKYKSDGDKIKLPFQHFNPLNSKLIIKE